MKLSIVILAYNRKDEVEITLIQCLKNEYTQTGNVEIILVDNESSDGTFELISKKFGDSIKIVRVEKNIGVAGWNSGFEIATGDYFLVLDDDSHPVSGLDAAVDYLDLNNNVGILSLEIIGGIYRVDEFAHLSEWIGFIGCGAIIRKELYNKIGGFPEWIFLYTHEFEYGIRAMEVGYKILVFKDAVIHHRASTINRANKRLITYTTRNELLIIGKYFPKEYQQKALLKKKLVLYSYVTKGIENFQHVRKGINLYKTDLQKIGYTPVSIATYSFYSDKFITKRSFFSLIFVYFPYWMAKGIFNSIKASFLRNN